MLCMPTGAGKSATTAYMVGRTKMRTLILCHRRELLDMISSGLPVEHGLILPGKKTPQNKILVGMVQTVQRRLRDLPDVQWVISDECHLAMAAGWQSILKHFASAKHLGMSATPCRLDGKGLGETFDEIVYGPSIRELVDLGHLVPNRTFAPPHTVKKLHKKGGDFDMAEASVAYSDAKILGDAVEHLRRLGAERRTLVFCCDIAHAERTSLRFREYGFSASFVHGGMDKDLRSKEVDDFRAGRTQVLCNVDLLTTGFDMPAIEAGVFLRPTQSLALYLQMCGRLLRPAPGKKYALILDHAGNVARHGFPQADREWTLDGRAKKGAAAGVKICPECFAAMPQNAQACPECGHSFAAEEPEGRDSSEDWKTRLVEVHYNDHEQAEFNRLRTAPLKQLVREARGDRAALQKIARARGFKAAWVHFAVSRHGKNRQPEIKV